MTIHWNQEDKRRYESLINEEMRVGCIVLAFLAIILFPIFGILDYFTQYEHLKQLWTIRGIFLIFYFMMFIYLYLDKEKFSVTAVSFLLSGATTFAISLQCNVLGGFVSSYYSGVILVMVATMAVFPVNAKKMCALLSFDLAIYIVCCMFKRDFELDQYKAVIHNMFILVAMTVIGSVACWWAEKSRILSFDRYLQLEKAKDMLRVELTGEQGNVESLVKEITHRKAELERALDLRKEFISLASHELNTPLTSLKLITQMVKHRVKKNQEIEQEDIKKLLNTYDEQILRLTRIVTDMLDVSKIEHGKLSLEKIDLDLDKLIQDIIEFLSVGYPSKIEYKSSGELIGNFDRLRIEQVMLNVINNAIKYGRGLPIEVTLEETDGTAVITVRDQGIGIPEELQGRIFDRFERAVNSYQFSGLGIGLYIADQIVKGHAGEITVRSKPGEGSEFKVCLPLTVSTSMSES